MTFRVLNLPEARFECTFGNGCDGICCKNGRPLINPDEVAKIQKLDDIIPLLRPSAARVILQDGFLSRRVKRGHRIARVVDGWCIFFNKGCTLHRLGAAEGDALKYKPLVCALFPLDRKYDGTWHVRQKGYNGEIWDLHCLDPQNGAPLAGESLKAELALAESITRAEAQQNSR